MNKILPLSLLAAMTLSMAACYAHPRHPHDGHFCPPGQAKKGHC